VIPQINCCSGSGFFLRKFTYVTARREMGRSGIFLQRRRITGMIGHSRLTASPRNASISLSCQGPVPLFPMHTATDARVPHPLPWPCPARSHAFARGSRYECSLSHRLYLSPQQVSACARGLQPPHDNHPRRLKPHCNSQFQTFAPVFAAWPEPATLSG